MAQVAALVKPVAIRSQDFDQAQIVRPQAAKSKDASSSIADHVKQLDPDSEFWWRTTGVPFATLLERAGYSKEDTDTNVSFYLNHIVPYLGPGANAEGKPQNWRSFMTDHFCPLEFSWEWGTKEQDPLVRYSFEPIGNFAGTEIDPYNLYAAPWLVRQVESSISGCDLELFDHFSKTLLSFTQPAATAAKAAEGESHASRLFLAYDLCKDGIVLKSYYLPAFKAKELGVTNMELIASAVQQLPPAIHQSFAPACNKLFNFATETTEELGLSGEIFAIDCISPETSRLKIYMRSRTTTWNSVKAVMTMGGALSDEKTAKGIEEMEVLWKSALGLDADYPADKKLPATAHRTGGILYYFEIRPGKANPSPKVYIPVRHYGKTDLSIAHGLESYLKSRNRGNLTSRYIEAMEAFSSKDRLTTERGVQTYLGCSIQGEKLKLTSYLAPKVFNL